MESLSITVSLRLFTLHHFIILALRETSILFIWGVIIAKIKFGICLPIQFSMFSLVFLMLRTVFNMFSVMFAKTLLLFCCSCIWLFITDYVCSFHMMLCETSMLLFMLQIMFTFIRVFRELERYDLAQVINQLCIFFQQKENLWYSCWQKLCGNRLWSWIKKILRQIALPIGISFYHVETLYNTVVSIR